MASPPAPSRGTPPRHRPRRVVVAGWLISGVLLFVAAEVVGSRMIPSPEAAAVAAIALRIAALLASLAGVAGYARELREVDEHRQQAAEAERAHEARSALAAIEHAARALPPAATPLPLTDAIVSEVAVIRRLLDPPNEALSYPVAEALLGPVTAARLAGTEVAVSLEDDLTARGEPAALCQIVQALLDNARRHAPGARVMIRGRQAGDRVELIVADDGPGIPPRLRARIFEPGVGAPHGAGSGLGLAAATGAAADQGGRLTLLPGTGGAAFRLNLPGAVPAGAAVP